MMKSMITVFLSLALISLLLSLYSCGGGSSGNTRTYVSHGVGYRQYYGRPWGYYPDYRPVDPGWEQVPDYPVAVPLPEPGYPDMGMPDMGGMDMGGFDF